MGTELISTDRTLIELEGEKYRISVKLKHDGQRNRYKVESYATRINSRVPHDTFASKTERVENENDLQSTADQLAEWAKKKIEERYEARQKEIDISSEVFEK